MTEATKRDPISDEELDGLRTAWLDASPTEDTAEAYEFIQGLQRRIEDLEAALAETPEVRGAVADRLGSLLYCLLPNQKAFVIQEMMNEANESARSEMRGELERLNYKAPLPVLELNPPKNPHCAKHGQLSAYGGVCIAYSDSETTEQHHYCILCIIATLAKAGVCEVTEGPTNE